MGPEGCPQDWLFTDRKLELETLGVASAVRRPRTRARHRPLFFSRVLFFPPFLNRPHDAPDNNAHPENAVKNADTDEHANHVRLSAQTAADFPWPLSDGSARPAGIVLRWAERTTKRWRFESRLETLLVSPIAIAAKAIFAGSSLAFPREDVATPEDTYRYYGEPAQIAVSVLR